MTTRRQTEVRVGMIGYKFMGKAHSHAYRDLPFFFDTPVKPVLQAIAGREEEGVKRAAERMGWSSCETDWRRLVERSDIDVVDIVTPNYMHAEMAIAALEAGKHVICEKPLAMNTEEAERVLEAARKSGKLHMICHNYRFAPAVRYAKKLIEEGRLGRIYHVRAVYLQDWIMDPMFPLVWRLQKDICGSGTHGDLAAHIIDLARYLAGEFAEVVGTMETFVKTRPIASESGGLSGVGHTGKTGMVDVDDASVFIARFRSGAIGTFEATRFAAGNRNGQRIEINGEYGSIRWDLENLNQLQLYWTSDEQGMQGYRTVSCTEEIHPYAGAYWPAGHIIGYEHTFMNMLYEFMNALDRGEMPQPNFEDGYLNQKVLDAVERSASGRTWVSV